ncbi:MAG: hypothetical protein AAF127_12625 [Pseudomonadota bacterium]
MPHPVPTERGAIYGLVAASDIALPELASANARAAAQVQIYEGALDWASPDNPPEVEDYLRGRPGDILIDVPGKLMMRIMNGTTITYQPYVGVCAAELRAFLLGSGLGALLAQRGALVLHANAIAMPDGSALICIGDSGAGKSTTAAAMMLRGYDVLADDVCPIASDGMIHPGLARMKLWDDAARKLGITTHGLERLPGERAKFNVPLPALASSAPRRPGLIVMLNPAPSDAITVTPLTGADKFVALRNNIYRPVFNRALENEPACLKRVSEIGAAADLVSISRPRDGFDIDQLIDTILECHASYRLSDAAQAGIV